MRAFAGGYYKNLKALYDYLGVRYQEQPSLFEFAESSVGRIRHALQWLYLVAAYTWFALCCFFVEPGRGETLQQYLHRTWISQHFITWYLLPLLSSVVHTDWSVFRGGDAGKTRQERRATHPPQYFHQRHAQDGVASYAALWRHRDDLPLHSSRRQPDSS